MPRVAIGVIVWVLAAGGVEGQESLQWSGFALLRAAVPGEGVPLDDDAVSAQVQVGVDWRPAGRVVGAHLHLLARNDADGSRRGRFGVVEAWADQTIVRGEHRVRLMEGAFFLPTSRENVDALWESPYTMTPSALNSWLGEELRPVGVDAAYTWRRRWTAGGTLYAGNDTLGALPPVRGWALRDRWTLLGEHVPVDAQYYTSVSAETDRRIGWSARGRWNSDRAIVQVTHFDNRSDALEHGELLNWDTQFTIAAAEVTAGDWSFLGETGWGRTDVIVHGFHFPSDIRASYLLVSRRLVNGRASLRVDEYRSDTVQGYAATAAFFWSPRGRVRAGVEAIVSDEDSRLAVEVRYSFGPW